MNFQDLHELVRLEILRRIDRGTLTGTLLARQSGFRQAHISNFLNRKRALSMEGLDRVLAAQNLSLEQILPLEIAAISAASPSALAESMEVVPIVSVASALHGIRILPAAMLDSIHVPAVRLFDNRARPAPRRARWQRFVALRLDAEQAAPMEPVLSTGTIAVLDRHYNSLSPYRPHQPTVSAVRTGSSIALRFVDFCDGHLVLRPYNRDWPVQLIPVAEHETPADYIVGRVCAIFSEL
jgi:hypothetical protein